MQPSSRAQLHCGLTTRPEEPHYSCKMSNKPKVRRHFIREWAEDKGFTQAQITEETGADKGLVSRWFGGVLPGHRYLAKLANLFGTTPDALFRHPSYDAWFSEFMEGRDEAECARIKRSLEATFPRPEDEDFSVGKPTDLLGGRRSSGPHPTKPGGAVLKRN